jgi:hypothetical protein
LPFIAPLRSPPHPSVDGAAWEFFSSMICSLVASFFETCS